MVDNKQQMIDMIKEYAWKAGEEGRARPSMAEIARAIHESGWRSPTRGKTMNGQLVYNLVGGPAGIQASYDEGRVVYLGRREKAKVFRPDDDGAGKREEEILSNERALIDFANVMIKQAVDHGRPKPTDADIAETLNAAGILTPRKNVPWTRFSVNRSLHEIGFNVKRRYEEVFYGPGRPSLVDAVKDFVTSHARSGAVMPPTTKAIASSLIVDGHIAPNGARLTSIFIDNLILKEDFSVDRLWNIEKTRKRAEGYKDAGRDIEDARRVLDPNGAYGWVIDRVFGLAPDGDPEPGRVVASEWSRPKAVVPAQIPQWMIELNKEGDLPPVKDDPDE